MVQREVLEEMVAQRLLEVVSQDDLETSYYEMQLEWAETLTDEDLIQTAQDLNVNITLEIVEAGTPNACQVVVLKETE